MKKKLRQASIKRDAETKKKKNKSNISTEKDKMKGVLKLNYDSTETCIIHPEPAEKCKSAGFKEKSEV